MVVQSRHRRVEPTVDEPLPHAVVRLGPFATARLALSFAALVVSSVGSGVAEALVRVYVRGNERQVV